MSLNFTHRTEVDTYGHVRLNWTRMALKPDFAATLERIGGLPLSKKEDIIETQRELKVLKRAQSALREKEAGLHARELALKEREAALEEKEAAF